jgi:hypothetical protein
MSDYDVGYGRPPKHSQFKKGVCPNPRGRGKRGDLQIGEIMKRVLNATTEFRDRGKVKKASRLELSVRRLATCMFSRQEFRSCVPLSYKTIRPHNAHAEYLSFSAIVIPFESVRAAVLSDLLRRMSGG